MTSPTPKTRYEQLIDRAKNHPIFSILLVISAASVGVAQFSDAIDKLSSRTAAFFSSSPYLDGTKLSERANVLTIESSDANVENLDKNLVVVTAEIRNTSDHFVEYPHVELIFQDEAEKPLARWIYRPEDYLAAKTRLAGGIPPNATISILLRPDAAGMIIPFHTYRLTILYPSHIH